MFPSATELAEMRIVAVAHLVHGTTVKILAATVGASDTYGRASRTWANPAAVTATPGRVAHVSHREQIAGIWTTVRTVEARLPIGTVVSHDDRILDVATGRTFDVGAISEQHSHLGPLYLRCDLSVTDGVTL